LKNLADVGNAITIAAHQTGEDEVEGGGGGHSRLV
jgi:hypothetical protein